MSAQNLGVYVENSKSKRVILEWFKTSPSWNGNPNDGNLERADSSGDIEHLKIFLRF